MPAGMPAYAYWVEFEACGRTGKPETLAEYGHFAAAPNLGRMFIWVTPGLVVSEMQVPSGAVACTGIAIGGFRYLVLGDYGAVICKLTAAEPYCKEPR